LARPRVRNFGIRFSDREPSGVGWASGIGNLNLFEEQFMQLMFRIVNAVKPTLISSFSAVQGTVLSSMARGGTYDKEHAEKFMWERVGLQRLVEASRGLPSLDQKL
jgi:hypothetical protein